MSGRRLLTLPELVAAVAFIIRTRMAVRRYRRHERAHEHHRRALAQAVDGMEREILVRVDLCAWRGDRLGRPVPRTSSGVPAVRGRSCWWTERT